MLLAVAFTLELARESLTGTHCRYREVVDGLPTENYVTRPCTPSPRVRGEGARRADEGLHWIANRIARRTILEETPHEPWAIDVDAETGEVLRRTPLFFHAKAARVFDPNPVVALNDTTLQDQNDSASAVPAAAYRDVELPDSALDGPWVTIVDRQSPTIPPPEGALVFDRADDGFEAVNAYFHIDRDQRYIQSLGYVDRRAIAPYAIEADAHALSEADNSFFIPSSTEAGKGILYFGDGGTDDAEDADLVVHEYTHAIQEWIAPGTFGGAFASESRAMAEGMADYWAYSQHVGARLASGRDPFCFADWDARCWLDDASNRCAYPVGTDCLRRLDSTKTMVDYDTNETSGVEHRNGAIWSSALREIHQSIGKHDADTILLESLFGAPARPTFAVMARRMLEADRLLYQASHAGAICSAMYARGILTQCDVTPRGELTHFQGGDYGIPIPENSPTGVTSIITIDDPRTIEKIYVRVDIAHSAEGDLRIELTAPDGTILLLHQLSSSRTRDVHVTYGLTAMPIESLDVLRGRSAAGQWKLFVADRRPRDTGTFLSWGLDIQFAGDEPSTTRPSGLHSKMIPVVAHLYGRNGAWVSEVRLANTTFVPQNAKLIFTRSTENGREHFAAIEAQLAPGQTIAFDDVVDRAFHTVGSGSLEVIGDVIATSRTYLRTFAALSEQVPAGLTPTFLGGAPLLVAPYDSNRTNLGLTETTGGSGVVQIDDDRTIEVRPFSHVQFDVAATLHEIRVIDGDARVVAYLSQVAGDAMFIDARPAVARVGIAPVISTQSWRSDVWLASRTPAQVPVVAVNAGAASVTAPVAFEDVLSTLFQHSVSAATLVVQLPDGVFGATRIVAPQNRTQFIPLLDPNGNDEQHILFVEKSDAYRTNVGIVTMAAATAEIVIYDAKGAEVERHVLFTSGGFAQTSVMTSVINGRAVVRFLEGSGRGYVSLIEVLSSDATFFSD
jgi:subtilisin-like proprotein convertase family protein